VLANSGASRVAARRSARRVSLLFLVALTGIEPVTGRPWQSAVVLSSSVFSSGGRMAGAQVAIWTADVLPRSCRTAITVLHAAPF